MTYPLPRQHKLINEANVGDININFEIYEAAIGTVIASKGVDFSSNNYTVFLLGGRLNRFPS